MHAVSEGKVQTWVPIDHEVVRPHEHVTIPVSRCVDERNPITHRDGAAPHLDRSGHRTRKALIGSMQAKELLDRRRDQLGLHSHRFLQLPILCQMQNRASQCGHQRHVTCDVYLSNDPHDRRVIY